MATNDENPMQQQRAELHFRRGITYAQQAARSIKKITSSELMHLNQMLVESNEDTWRFDAVEIEIPSGTRQQFNLLSNPINRARDILGEAVQMAGNQQPKEAALYVYCELVLAHLFRDANRRTAVLATVWILESAGLQVDPQKLHDLPLGDLRDEANRIKFGQTFNALIS